MKRKQLFSAGQSDSWRGRGRRASQFWIELRSTISYPWLRELHRQGQKGGLRVSAQHSPPSLLGIRAAANCGPDTVLRLLCIFTYLVLRTTLGDRYGISPILRMKKPRHWVCKRDLPKLTQLAFTKAKI